MWFMNYLAYYKLSQHKFTHIFWKLLSIIKRHCGCQNLFLICVWTTTLTTKELKKFDFWHQLPVGRVYSCSQPVTLDLKLKLETFLWKHRGDKAFQDWRPALEQISSSKNIWSLSPRNTESCNSTQFNMDARQSRPELQNYPELLYKHVGKVQSLRKLKISGNSCFLV